MWFVAEVNKHEPIKLHNFISKKITQAFTPSVSRKDMKTAIAASAQKILGVQPETTHHAITENLLTTASELILNRLTLGSRRHKPRDESFGRSEPPT